MADEDTNTPAPEAEAAPAAPKRRSRAKKVVLPVDTDVAIELAVADASSPELVTGDGPAQDATNDAANEDDGDGQGPRRGWWQRTFGA